jgi:hypothetical protein
MKHAGTAALDRLEPLLQALRAIETLKERSRGVFYFKSKAFLHFHEDPAGLFADVRPRQDADFDRLQVDDDRAQAALLEIVRQATGPGR